MINDIYATRSAVQPWRCPTRSCTAFRVKFDGSPLRQEGGSSIRGRREVDTAGGTTASHTSKFQPHNLKPNDGSALVQMAMLTFSSIPPLMTGLGSGPAGKKIRGELGVRPAENRTLESPGRDTSHPAPSEWGAPLCKIKSLPAAHLSFHQHLLCYIAEVWAPHLLFTCGSSPMRWCSSSSPRSLYLPSSSCRINCVLHYNSDVSPPAKSSEMPLKVKIALECAQKVAILKKYVISDVSSTDSPWWIRHEAVKPSQFWRLQSRNLRSRTWWNLMVCSSLPLQLLNPPLKL